MKDPFLIRGPRNGPCSICGTPDALTIDHVPPKGATRIGAVEMRDLMERLSIEGLSGKYELSQDGVKFRSLCRICNNERLGAGCDPELVSLCNHADATIRSRLILPGTFSANVRPMRVLRAIVGHLLATQSGRVPVGTFERGMAQFFLNTKLPPPPEMECFYWPYPFNDQVILRDVSKTKLGTGISPLLFKLLKFYPLSFMLIWQRDASVWPIPGAELTRYRGLSNDDTASIAFDLRSIPHQRWPEAPSDDEAIMMGGRPMYARPRTPTKPKPGKP